MDATQFLPSPHSAQTGGRVTVVALSRLVYRKGVDLLNVVVPAVCRRHPHVDFIIGAPVTPTPRCVHVLYRQKFCTDLGAAAAGPLSLPRLVMTCCSCLAVAASSGVGVQDGTTSALQVATARWRACCGTPSGGRA